MKPNTKLTILAALFALALALLAGCGGAASAPDERAAEAEPAGEAGSSPYAGNFAGRVEGTDAFVAVVVDKENNALAFVSDAKEEGPSALRTAEWFRGEVTEGGALDLQSEGGARLVANVSEDETEGTLTLEGAKLPFEAQSAEGEAGLYRAQETVDGEEHVGGWILLSNGEERGAVKRRGSGFIDLEGDLARPSEPVDGFSEQGAGI